MNWLTNAAGTAKEIYSELTIHGQIPNLPLQFSLTWTK